MLILRCVLIIRPHRLFRLFYQVKIKHRPNSLIETPILLAAADFRDSKTRLWQLWVVTNALDGDRAGLAVCDNEAPQRRQLGARVGRV